jgi:hypothetical protein
MQHGMTASAVARLHGIFPGRFFGRRHPITEGGLKAVRADKDVVADILGAARSNLVNPLRRPDPRPDGPATVPGMRSCWPIPAPSPTPALPTATAASPPF